MGLFDEDVIPLQFMTNLEVLNLGSNQTNDWSPVEHVSDVRGFITSGILNRSDSISSYSINRDPQPLHAANLALLYPCWGLHKISSP